MSWFSRTPRKLTVQTELGTFRFEHDGWMTDPNEGSLMVLFSGRQLDNAVIEAAAKLITKLEVLADIGQNYARKCGQNVWDGKGELTPELLDVTDLLDGKFGLTYGVSGHPDTTVTIEFHDEKPIEVWAAD